MGYVSYTFEDVTSEVFLHTEILTGIAIDDTAGLTAVEVYGGCDELRHIEGEETVAVELSRIALRQHKGLGNGATGIDVTEIRSREETVVASGTQNKPARVGTPIVERLRILRVGRCHGTALSRSKVKQPEIGLVVPDAELSVVGERVTEETAVIGRSGERYRLMLSHGIDNRLYTVTKATRSRIEADAAKVIADGIKLMTALRKGASCTEID